jgi:hypothetical protein
MNLRIFTKYIPLVLSLIVFFNVSYDSIHAAPPLLPMVLSGDITVKSNESSDNQILLAQILNTDNSILFTSQSVIVKDNKYIALTIGPLDSKTVGKSVRFLFMCGDNPCNKYAEQIIPFQQAKVIFRYNLIFDSVPPSQSELQAAAAKEKADALAKAVALAEEEKIRSNEIAEAKAAAAAAAAAAASASAASAAETKAEAEAKAKADLVVASAPTQSNSDTKPPNETKAYPSIYSGTLVAAGTSIPSDAILKAQIGNYISSPALINGNNFQNLVISPNKTLYIGEPITFYLNDVKSEPTNETYIPGETSKITLAFIGLQSKAAQINDIVVPEKPQAKEDQSSGSGCSFVSARNNNNYSGLISFAVMLLIPLSAYRRSKK